MPQPTGLIFWDWNGTLLDDVSYSIDCLNALLEEYGYPQRYTPDAYREIFGFPIEEYYRRAGFDFARHPYPRLAESYMRRYTAGVARCTTTPHAAQTLAALQRQGWQQVVLSVSRRDHLIEQVTGLGLKGYFSELLGLSDIYGVSKVQLGRDWLQSRPRRPARCVMVGDTTHDAETAAALGARCILYAGGHQPRARLEAACPTVIDRLDALPGLLAQP